MKNKHIISTDKPSRLGRFIDTNNLFLRVPNDIPRGINVNIYITSDEKIKEGDWFLLDMSHSSHPNEVHQMGHNKWSKTGGINFSEPNSWTKACKKIILTTDANLIKDGVQEIDEEYLEWFVKNPSCESVEVKTETWYLNKRGWQPFPDEHIEVHEKKKVYKIIIPKEEFTMIKGGDDIVFPSSTTITFNPLPDVNWESDITNKVWDEDEPKQIKCYCGHTITCDCEPLQETLEDAAESWVNNRFTKQICGNESYPDIHASKEGIVESHIIFAKWQKERMYSEDEVKHIISEALQSALVTVDLEQWFEQFKKK
jgi:hypothetical protein